jgi:arylsulfatase A-like enzyme
MVERLDTIVGRYIDLLRETGQLENTIIIFTSDHGEMLGDCGLWEKFVPHQASIAVPLVFAGPGIAQGQVCAPATILDIHATVTELAQAAVIEGIDSRSMCATLRDPGHGHREVAFSGLGDWRIAYDGTYKLVAGYDLSEARRDMENGHFDPNAPHGWRLIEPAADPSESFDLTAAAPDIARRLRDALVANATKPRPQATERPTTAVRAG